jgi:hypothetical protein
MSIELLNMDCMEYMATLPDQAVLAKQKKAARMKLWYAETKETRLESARKYRQENKAAFNQYRNNYRTKNPAGIFDCIKQSAKKRGVVLGISRADFIDWHNVQPKVCVYCSRSEDEANKDVLVVRNKATRLTIDRKDNEEGYTLRNITLSCMRCNSIKSNYFSYDEMKEIGVVIKRKHECQK